MNATEILALLQQNAKITTEDISEVLFAKIEEELALKNITIPTIASRVKGTVVQYYTTVPARYSKTGVRHQIVALSEEEVKRLFQREVYNTLKHSEYIELRETITVAEVVELYLNSLRPNGGRTQRKKKTTIERYERMYRNHVKETGFGKMLMSQVRAYHCEDYIACLYGANICKSHIAQIKSLVKMSFDFAISRELTDRNFMATVEINPTLCSTVRKREVEVWEDAEVKILWDTSVEYWKKKQYRYSALILIMLFLGCRIGELSALTWDDIDFANGFITFDKTIIEYTDYETHKKRREIDAPKTEESRRKINLNEYAAFWLKELKRRNEEIGIYSKQVVVTKYGKIPKEDQLAISFQRFCRVAGVPYKSSHTCRRTYATTMIDGGIPIRQVANDMGHKKVSTTLDVYYKAKKEDEKMLEQKCAVFRKLYGDIYDRENLATVGNTPETSLINLKTP